MSDALVKAEALTNVVNAAIAQSGEPYELAVLLMAVSAKVIGSANDSDLRVYAGTIRRFATAIDGQRQ